MELVPVAGEQQAREDEPLLALHGGVQDVELSFTSMLYFPAVAAEPAALYVGDGAVFSKDTHDHVTI